MRGKLITAIRAYVAAADAVSGWIGKGASVLVPGVVGVCFAVAVLRYGLGWGRAWMQELYVWLHAMVFMLGAAYVLREGGHVRVDLLHGRMGPRLKAWIDILGTGFFLLPWMALLAIYGGRFAASAYRIGESSSQPGGMPDVFLLKLAIPVFAVSVALQGLALAGRAALVLLGAEREAAP
jgi:TRAP-type mannitol/chloroaromatic compound transport system permease small subunit